MVCNDVKRIAYFYLDGTLGEQRKTEFKKHLDECHDCDSRVVFHQRIRDFFRRRVQSVAPDSLKARIVNLWRSPAPDPSR
jgi:mycothiol system anti-sigma-R factor